VYCDKAPKTCYNFLQLARQGEYDNWLFHRLHDLEWRSHWDRLWGCWGTPFRDEYDTKGAATYDGRGMLAMADKGPGTNGSQFQLTFRATPNLDNKHTVFGKLVGGDNVLKRRPSKLERSDRRSRCASP
ncbi:cyclophilin-like protein, partial [Cylindrobasidium torrendii FP15055 ss-10]